MQFILNIFIVYYLLISNRIIITYEMLETEQDNYSSTKRILNVRDIQQDVIDEANDILKSIINSSDPNQIYMECFKLLKLGGLEAEIPRLVVFGTTVNGENYFTRLHYGGSDWIYKFRYW